MRLQRAVRALGVCALLVGSGAAAQTTISTYSSDPSRPYMGFFGKGMYPWLVSETFGQVFAAPADPVLTGFSFWATNFDPPEYVEGLVFSAYVMEWAGDRAVGPVLYESDPVAAPTVSVPTRQRFDFGVSGLTLDPGSLYVAFLSTSEYFGIIPEEAASFDVLTGVPDPNAFGFWYQNTENDPATLTTQPWQTFDAYNLAFEAQFQPPSAPEPASLLLLGTGLAGLAAVGRRRRRS